MTVDVSADADTGSATLAEPVWHARWLIIARWAWPVLTVLAITANLLVLPEYTRSLLTRTIRAELPAAHLTPAEYVAIQICYVAVFMLICLAVATVIYVRAVMELLRSDVAVHGLAHITGGGLLNLLRLGRIG